MGNKIKISVMYTIYGDFDIRKLESALLYLSKQKGIIFEAVVANATGKELDPPAFCKVIYVNQDEAKKNLGIIRNYALKNCQGEYVYICDSDILFYDKLFLKKLLKLHEKTGTALKKVNALRLPIEEVEEFYKSTNKGITPKLKLSELSASLSENFPFQIRESNGYKFTQRADGKDSMPLVHAGTTFAKRETFEEVGGYSEEYIGYGWEDSDIQWKLGQKTGMEKIKGLSVIHLDHERSYYEKKQFEANKLNFFKRVREGVDNAVKNDVKNYVLIGTEVINQSNL